MEPDRGWPTAAALLATFCLAGCALAPPPPPTEARLEASGRTVTAIGVFDDYNEILRGRATTDPVLHLQFLDFTGVVSGIRCVGHGRITHMPPGTAIPVDCEGWKGITQVTCTDGRALEIDYTVEKSCSTGWGTGLDQYENTLSFVFGLPEDEAEDAVRREMRRASRRRPLETYDPGEVRAEQGYSTGTAFAVRPDGWLVTSHHVVAGTDRIWLIDDEGNEHPVEYVAGDEENDVALLHARGFSSRALPIRRTETLRKGDDVIALGYPLVSLQGQEQKATFGRINAMSGAMGDTRFLQVDAPIQPGNSGGPLLDVSGNVVGVVTATLDQVQTFRSAGVVPQNVNYVLRAEYVLDLLARASDEGIDPSEALRRDASNVGDVVGRAEGAVYLVIARSAED